MSDQEWVKPADSLRAFRACLGQFATGVTVVTCQADDGHPCGITANSFSSVSLDPPLVLWNIAKSSHSLQAYLVARYFAVNVLTEAQEKLAVHFARTDHTLFDNVSFSNSEEGVPLLPDCAAIFECSTYATYDAGDHYIILGEVERMCWHQARPLLFFRGNYRRLGRGTDDGG